MALWTEDMWVLVLQLMQQKPVGVKPMFAPETVNLAIELHIPPQEIYRRMFMLRQPEAPSLRHLVDTLSAHPKRLNKEAEKVRRFRGCGNEQAFFEGVEIVETFEKDFKPIHPGTELTPMMLVMILDLYFRLIPSTMVTDTPDVQDLAHLMHVSAQDVADVLEIYQYCDPYLGHTESLFDPLYPICYKTWHRFDYIADPEKLTNLAAQLKAYWN